MKKRVRAQDLIRFQGALRTDERSANTVSKYLRDAAKFQKFLEQDYFSCLSKQAVIAYKERLTRQYKPSSVNSMLAAINGFLVFLGRPDCKVKLLKIQRTNFRLSERELSRSEYRRLLDAAKQRGDERIVPAHAGHLLHGHPGERAAVHHRGDPEIRHDTGEQQGQGAGRAAAP